MSETEAVLYDKKDGVAYITLNRPDKLNAYNTKMRDALYDILGALKDDSEVRVGILRAAGEKAFCAGADLSEFLTAPSPVIARQVRWERDVWGRFLSVPQPLIAAMHGFVLGSGIEMALCCDIRIATEDAQFGLPETSLGIIPAAGGTQTLPRVIGRGKALEMLLTGSRLTAPQALQAGLVNSVVSRAQLMPAAGEMARVIASFDLRAVAATKNAVVRGLDMSLAEGIRLESQLSANLSCLKRLEARGKTRP